MTLEYRAKAYYQPGGGRNTILYSGHSTRYDAEQLLAGFLSLHNVTGGHIERHVQGVGWVLNTDSDEEIERRRVEQDTIYPHQC